MLGLKWIHVSKSGHWHVTIPLKSDELGHIWIFIPDIFKAKSMKFGMEVLIAESWNFTEWVSD